jgi:hypothetical protein
MTAKFLAELNRLDVRVWAEGDKLRCSAPEGVLTVAMREELAARKPEIIAMLRIASAPRSCVVPIQPMGSRRPFFGVPGHNGDVYCYVRFSGYLGTDQPFYALEPPGLDGQQPPLLRIEDIAARYVTDIRRVQPAGPYQLGGYCFGGAIAFEVARQLEEQGQEIALLALLEAACPTVLNPRHRPGLIWRVHWRRLTAAQGTVIQRTRRLIAKVRDGGVRGALSVAPPQEDERDAGGVVGITTRKAWCAYRPRCLSGRVQLIFASEESRRLSLGRTLDWGRLSGGAEIRVGPSGCLAHTMLREPYVKVFAEFLEESMSALARSSQGPMTPRSGSGSLPVATPGTDAARGWPARPGVEVE